MITTVLANTRPAIRGILATKTCTEIVQAITEDFSEYCRCLCACPIVLRVFAKEGGVTQQKDKTSFLYKRTISTDTISMELWKDGVKIENLNDNDFGTFYDFGDLTDGSLKGYLLDWTTVYGSYGYGTYQVKAITTSAGAAVTLESDLFECLEYTDERADGTVKIETYQNGYIMSGFDLTGQNWYQSWRIPGWFGQKEPTFQTDNVLNTAREIVQVQDSIRNLYTLETSLLPSAVLNWIAYDGILANRILITDYNLCNFERDKYNQLEVYPESIEEFSTYRHNPNGHGIFKFTDKKQNIIKRNYI